MKTSEAQRRAWDGGRSGRPAPAFDDAAHGSRGWGIRPADVAVGAATLFAALGVCCVLWFGFGVQGVPGVSLGEGSGAEVGAGASEVASGTKSTDAGVAGYLDTQASNLDAGGPNVQPSGLGVAGSDAQSLNLDAGGPKAQASVPDAGGTPTASGQGSADLGIDAGSTYTASDAGDAVATLYAVIQNSDGFYQVLPLGEDTTVTVAGSLGTNIIEVADGRVRCLESDCSNQTCVKQGWVSGLGQTVVCLPHKLIVQLVADPADAVPLS